MSEMRETSLACKQDKS